METLLNDDSFVLGLQLFALRYSLRYLGLFYKFFVYFRTMDRGLMSKELVFIRFSLLEEKMATRSMEVGI